MQHKESPPDAQDFLGEYKKLIEKGKSGKVDECLLELRRLIITHGIPEIEETEEDVAQLGSLRGQIWCLLLRIGPFVSAKEYIRLVEKGDSRHARQIELDKTRVPKELQEPDRSQQRVRITNAFCHLLDEAKGFHIDYAQVEMIKLSYFTHVLPELHAFWCFYRFRVFHSPTYLSNQTTPYPGCYTGVKLITKILSCFDPELALLFKRNDHFLIMLFDILAGGSLADKPKDIFPLMDVVLACGAHMDLLFLVARIVLSRSLFFQEGNNQFVNALQAAKQQSYPAKSLISTAFLIQQSLPKDVNALVTYHTLHKITEHDIATYASV